MSFFEMLRIFFSFSYLGLLLFHIHDSQDNRGKGKPILTPLYHFHPLHQLLDISRAITASKVFISEAFACRIFAKYLGKEMWRGPFKVKLCEDSKSSYFPKRTLRVSFQFGPRVSFIFLQGHQKV